MTEPLLSVRDLRTYFDTYTEGHVIRAVDGVSFDVGPGEALAIAGESGSGKSVTGLSILRLIPEPPGRHAGGTIHFLGRDLTALGERELRAIRGSRISMVFQDPETSLNPLLTVGRQLTEVLEVHAGLGRAEAKATSIAMLARVRLGDPELRFDQHPHLLSGGMRQRVAIAMALLARPALLVADEPTTSLDMTVQAEILDLIDELRRDLGTSLLLITHDLGVAARMADRLLVMVSGKVVEEGPAADLLSDPRHPYTRALLDSVPRLGDRRRLAALPGLPPDPLALPSGCAFRPRCSRAVERCAIEAPPLVRIGERRSAACWAPIVGEKA